MNQMSAPPPTRGLIVVVVAVVVGVILLAVGYDDAGIGSANIDAGSDSDEQTTDTTVPPVTATTQPAGGEAPADVPVYVANGSGVSGKAAEVTATLTNAGYTAALPPGNATTTEISQVFYLPEFDVEAQAVATALGLPTDRAVPWADAFPDVPAEAQVIVQVGTDLAG
jgi:hypothetical protein